MAALPLECRDRVLEVGCGTGALARQIARQFPDGAEIVGLDLSPDHVDFATTAAANEALDAVRFVRGDGRNPPAEFLDRFDIALARYVFMYAMADGTAIDLVNGMIRCLRPGGRLILIEADINFGSHMHPPPAEPLATVMRNIVEYYRDRGGIEWRAGIRLHEFLSKAGLRNIDIRMMGCRIIQGGRPLALVEHDGKDLDILMAPVPGSHPDAPSSAALAEQWRHLLSDEGSFAYTPIFMASWIKSQAGWASADAGGLPKC